MRAVDRVNHEDDAGEHYTLCKKEGKESEGASTVGEEEKSRRCRNAKSFVGLTVVEGGGGGRWRLRQR
jgi:hypothetical protein